jgi:hypothetical protein
MSTLLGVFHAFAAVETLAGASFEAHTFCSAFAAVLQTFLLVEAFLMASASHTVLLFELLLLLLSLESLRALPFVLFILGDTLFGAVGSRHGEGCHFSGGNIQGNLSAMHCVPGALHTLYGIRGGSFVRRSACALCFVNESLGLWGQGHSVSLVSFT